MIETKSQKRVMGSQGNKDRFHSLVDILSNDSTIALGQSSSSMEFEEYKLNEKVDLITTTFGSKAPSLPLREERRSLGVETVFKAKGVGWQGVRKKYTYEKKEKEKRNKFLGCSYVISWDTCGGGSRLKACLADDDASTFTFGTNLSCNATYVDKEEYLKALTYEEYLEYLRRCQEKIKHGEKDLNYLELETLPETVSETTSRRHRLFTSQLEEQRDDGIYQALSDQDIRDLPTPMHSLSLSSFISKEDEKLPGNGIEDIKNDDDDKLMSQKKLVSFASHDEIRTIPSRSPKSKRKGSPISKRDVASEEKDIKEELLRDVDVILKNLALETKMKHESLFENDDTTIESRSDTDPNANTLRIRSSQSAKQISTNIDSGDLKPISQIDELSPLSKIQVSRGTNLLDSTYATEQVEAPVLSPKEKNENKNANEIGMKGLINVDVASPKVVIRTAPKAVHVSPLGKGAAADLARNLLKDIESMKSNFYFTKPTASIVPHKHQQDDIDITDTKGSDQDLMKVDSDLREDQIKRSMESISLAKMILAEVRTSLDEEEEAISRSSSVDSAEVSASPSVSLSRSILEEIKSGRIPPPVLCKDEQVEQEDRSGSVTQVETESENMSVMKVDSDLREDQIKRSIESISLAKMILAEVRTSLDEEEEAISRSSSVDSAEVSAGPSVLNEVESDLGEHEANRSLESSDPLKSVPQDAMNTGQEETKVTKGDTKELSGSFPTSSQSVFVKRFNYENDGDCGVSSSPRRPSANLNHPAILAQRRVQSIRERHQVVADGVTKSMSQESEDSWSQAQDISTVKEKGIFDEKESMSISVKKLSSAQQARRLLEQASIRHKRIAAITTRIRDESISRKTTMQQKFVSGNLKEPIQSMESNNAYNDEVDPVEETTFPVKYECKTGDNKICKQNITSPPKDCSDLTEKDKDENTDRGNKPRNNHTVSQSMLSSSPDLEEEEGSDIIEKFSSYSDSSIDSMGNESQTNLRHSANLARRLVENAKLRVEKVKKKPTFASSSVSGETTNRDESKQRDSLFKEFQGSSELAQRLLLEAFNDNKGLAERKKISLPQTSTSVPSNTQGEKNSQSIELTRKIMNQAGFSDLFAPFEEESFEKILKIGSSCDDDNDQNKQNDKEESNESIERISFEPSSLTSIEEENFGNKRLSSQQATIAKSLTYDNNTLVSTASESTDHQSSTFQREQQSLFQTDASTHNDKLEKPNTASGSLVSPESNSDFSFKTCITSPQTNHFSFNADHQIKTLKTVKKSNLSDKQNDDSSFDQQSPSKLSVAHEEFEDQKYDDVQYTIPQSFSMVSCNSHSTNGFSIKSSKSIDDISAEFEIEESLSFTVNELNRINSMLQDAESSCHSSRASDDRDALFFAKQTKHEIATLAKAIERKVKAEQNRPFPPTGPQVSQSYTEDSCDNSSSYRQIRTVGSPLKQDRMAKSPAMDRLIEDVNELCNKIENRIDNIVSDTQT